MTDQPMTLQELADKIEAALRPLTNAARAIARRYTVKASETAVSATEAAAEGTEHGEAERASGGVIRGPFTFAEPDSGCVFPAYDPAHSHAILNRAAGWYGEAVEGLTGERHVIHPPVTIDGVTMVAEEHDFPAGTFEQKWETQRGWLVEAQRAHRDAVAERDELRRKLDAVRALQLIRARLEDLDIPLDPWQRRLIEQMCASRDDGIYVTDPRRIGRQRIRRMHIAYSRKRGHHR